jgi:polyisoprenoid-binding protein YceI
MRRLIVMVSVAFVAAAVCQAADWDVDPYHSSVSFSVKHLMISNVKGGFTKFTGTAKYDPADPATFDLTGTLETASIDTGVAMRDNDLRSENFFDAKKFPLITFKSKELKKVADGSYQLVADLGMHGVTNTVTFQLKGLGAPINFNGLRVGFSLAGMIERDKFGLTYNKMVESVPAVGNEVQLSGEIEIVQKKAPAKP